MRVLQDKFKLKTENGIKMPKLGRKNMSYVNLCCFLNTIVPCLLRTIITNLILQLLYIKNKYKAIKNYYALM